MSDWRPGDLALRINTGTPCPDCGLRPDTVCGVYTVTFVGRDAPVYLLFAEIPATRSNCVRGLYHYGEYSPNFRKIRPHTPDAEDRETIRLLTGKPVPVTA